MGTWDKVKGLFVPPPDPAPGITHFRGEGELDGVRLHLRIEAGGSGVLIVNAANSLPDRTMRYLESLCVLANKLT